MIKATDPILGPVRGNAPDVIAAAMQAAGGAWGPHLADYITEAYRLAPLVGMDPLPIVAQSALECDNWRPDSTQPGAIAWKQHRNPASIGLLQSSEDAPIVNLGYHWESGEDAARAHIVHLFEYLDYDDDNLFLRAMHTLSPYEDLDPRRRAVVEAGWDNSVRTWADLSNKWAGVPDYGQRIANRGNQIFSGLTGIIVVRDPFEHQEASTGMSKQIVVVVPGHRGIGDDGSREEAALTPALAREYVTALKAAGHDAYYLPEHDGDTMPDNTQGGLDGVGRATLDLCRRVSATVMLDVHYEGTSTPGIRGCFGIVPNVTGLRTAIANGAPPDDTWDANTVDRQLAAAISKRIEETTGIPRRGVRELGVMDEKQTYVATEYGARLAMFAYTAPVRQTCVRLVVEHGAISNAQDRAIIYTEAFTEQCAQGLVRAFNDVYGPAQQTPVTTPAPNPTPSPVVFFEGMDEGVATWLFGQVELEPNKFYPFDPNGMLSKEWLAYGKETGIWGAPPSDVGRVKRFDTRSYLPMRSGLVLWRANDRERYRPLKTS